VTVRLVPERTVDSLVAHELLRAVPTGLILSPSNTLAAVDHRFYAGASPQLVLECKGVDRRTVDGRWTVPLDLPQLDHYCSQRGQSIQYYLLSMPVDRPWIRKCSVDADLRGRCVACRPVPADRRALAKLKGHIKKAPLELRVQPWVSHWSWLVSAGDLQAHVSGMRTPGQVSLTLDGSDAAMSAIPNARRFCHAFRRRSSGAILNARDLSERLDLRPVPYEALSARLADDPESTDPFAFEMSRV
jgi:hypothetical protein